MASSKNTTIADDGGVGALRESQKAERVADNERREQDVAQQADAAPAATDLTKVSLNADHSTYRVATADERKGLEPGSGPLTIEELGAPKGA